MTPHRSGAGRRGRLRGWSLALLLTGALTTHGAQAQAPPREQAAPEQNFWEKIYDPGRPAYRQEVDRAWEVLEAEQADMALLDPHLAELARLGPQAGATLYFQGVMASARGDHPAALDAFERLVASDDYRDIRQEVVFFDYAVALTRAGRHEEALAAYDRCLSNSEVHANRAVYYGNQAELFMALGRLDEAIDHYREALSRRDDYLHALFGLAVALERRGDHGLARGYLLRGITLDPGLEDFLGKSTTFFVPAADRAFFAGLIAEEHGRHQDALNNYRLYLELAAQDGGRYLEAGRKALARVEAAGDPRLAHGALEFKVEAVAADPGGRYLALAGPGGRVEVGRLGGARRTQASGAGAPVHALAALDNGELMVGRNDGVVEVYSSAGRKARTLNPLTTPSGRIVRAFSQDGSAVMVSGNNARRFALVALAEPGRELHQIHLPALPTQSLLPRWSPEGNTGMGLFLVTTGEVHLRHLPGNLGGTSFKPPAGDRYKVVALSPDGHYAVVVGTRTAAVYRLSDLQLVRQVALEVEASWGAPTQAAVDLGGGAGLGPALLVFYNGGYTAWKLGAILP